MKKRKLSQEKIVCTLELDRDNSKLLIEKEFKLQELYDFLHSSYGVVVIPIPFKHKINKLLSGEAEGILKPIPIEHLLDMWKQRIKDLNKIYQYNISKGKELDKSSRLNYDLAVLINKYDAYLDWNTREMIKSASFLSENSLLETTVQKVNKYEKTDENEISELLDELF